MRDVFLISGNLLDEAEVLDWMVKQKNDESIEEIDRDTLTKYIETKEFLAVVFCKGLIYYYEIIFIFYIKDKIQYQVINPYYLLYSGSPSIGLGELASNF